MATFFVGFGAKSLSTTGKFVQEKNGNQNSPQVDKLFFPNLYKLCNLYVLMDIYLCGKFVQGPLDLIAVV
jgi:hypothetical protein